MVAYPLIFGELTSQSYTDESAADPRIDALRAKIHCVEEQSFSVDYHEPSKRSISNALLVELNDGTVLDEVEIEYPVGHKRRRAEGTPLLMAKFRNHIAPHFPEAHQKTSVSLCTSFSDITDACLSLSGSLTLSTMPRAFLSSLSTNSQISSSRPNCLYCLVWDRVFICASRCILYYSNYFIRNHHIVTSSG